MRLVSLIVLSLLTGSVALAQTRITPAEAKNHIGVRAQVCGKVASATYASHVNGQPTFLNLDKPFPDHVFTVFISGRDRHLFGRPEITYLRRSICVSGVIKLHKGRPEIIATSPTQIEAR